jgi:hypothetical protein
MVTKPLSFQLPHMIQHWSCHFIYVSCIRSSIVMYLLSCSLIGEVWCFGGCCTPLIGLQHSVITQMTSICIFTTMKTSNLCNKLP